MEIPCQIMTAIKLPNRIIFETGSLSVVVKNDDKKQMLVLIIIHSVYDLFVYEFVKS